ncbi:hypothetical protein [uncultured Virgibacillus sp.]|nr:hypothetical protein [uncultured Virgibacillus sp.]
MTYRPWNQTDIYRLDPPLIHIGFTLMIEAGILLPVIGGIKKYE